MLQWPAILPTRFEGFSVDKKTPIGKILVEKKAISAGQLDQALDRQRDEGGRLASNLMEMGVAVEEDLLLALSEQQGMPAVDLTRSLIPLSALDLVPEGVALDANILPLAMDKDWVRVAISNPEEQRTLDEIAFISGRKVEAYLTLEARLRHAVKQAYLLKKKDPKAQFFRGDRMDPPSPDDPPEGKLLILKQQLPEPEVGLGTEEELVTIEVSAADEVKTEEEIILELEEEVSEPLPAAGKRPQPLVLVVDDEEDIVRLLEKALTADGLEVIAARRGLEALEMVQKHNPDLILLDAMLPEIHGFEICRKIKSSQRFSQTPVVMVSAIYRGWRYAQDIKETYGADDFFEKPFRLVPLMRRVRELLKGHEVLPAQGVSPEQIQEMYQRGIALHKAKNFEDAEVTLREACGLDPFNVNLHYALASVLLARDQVLEAIQELETTVELKPDLYAPLRNLAVLYQKNGFKNKAVEMWERALRVCPEDKEREKIKAQLMKLL